MTYLQLYRDQIREAARSNRAVEAENYRHNVRTENENQRYHQATEEIQRSVAAETFRHDTETEGIQIMDVDERVRANKMNEILKAKQLGEEIRHSKSVEQETFRHSLAEETERHRSNVVYEALGQQREDTNRLSAIWGGVNNTVRNIIEAGDLVLKVVGKVIGMPTLGR